MKIEGKVSTIIFKNESNSWTVMLLKVGKEYITAVGTTDEIEVNDELELEGEEDLHKIYGKQFKFSKYKKILPRTNTAIIDYIANNIEGVGKKTARRIVNAFEDNTINVIRFEPDKLRDIKGLNDDKIDSLNTFFNEEYEKWNAIEYLTSFGISVPVSTNIYKELGADTITIVKENPYSLLSFVKSLEFKFVDEIGRKLGVDLNNEDRIDSGILYAINKITEFGHTCIELENLSQYAAELLEVSNDTILNGIKRLNLREKVYIQKIEDTEYIFRSGYYLAEENIAKNVVDRTLKDINKKDYTKIIKEVSKKNNIELSDEQKESISTCLNSNISVITGGPGTGKTTIIKCIIDILEELEIEYVLCAPTGRAAKRIKETTKKEAKTIHRLLEISKLDDNDIEAVISIEVKQIEADVVIVDEASMIDCLMMNNLFKAMKPTTKVILVGDADQLPSVGPGNVLKDIISSKTVNVVALKKIYRQSSQSDIILNAHRVNNGEYPEFKNKDTDMFLVKTISVEDTIKNLQSLVSYRLKNFVDLDIIKDLQVLTPMKKTQLGTIQLNSLLQEILNPKSAEKREREFNNRILREGDKVMQIVNNYDKKFSIDGKFFDGIYNGDIGFIQKIDNIEKTVTVIFDDEKEVVYEFDELDELELAYAVTVHKSQGSEFDYCILPLYSGYPKLFTRNLLYTAMTRAKKMLIIVGSKNIVNFMVDNIESKKRKTGLKYKILEKL